MNTAAKNTAIAAVRHLCVGLSLVAVITAATWPWMQHPGSQLPNHFDPPFHASKLHYMADTLLSGHLIPPHGAAHVFYPSSNAVFFDALLLPQAVISLPLRLFTDNHILIYNLVHLFTWALSGYALYLLLRAAALPRLAAWLGGALFCVMPYRIGYIVEFNMQQCFGIPLFFLCMVKFIQRPSIRWAIAMALTFVVQATSELYQALFLVFTAPLVAFPFICNRYSSLVRSRRFWTATVTCVALTAAACFVTLGGYLELADAAGFSRSQLEMRGHSLEPLAYLSDARIFSGIPGAVARCDETPAFPGFVVLAFAMLYAISERRIFGRAGDPGDKRRLSWGRYARFVCALLPAIVIAAIYGCRLSGTTDWLAVILNLSLCALLALTAALSLADRLAPDRRRLLTGLALAAMFAFLMSLGPTIGVRDFQWGCTNWLFAVVEPSVPLVKGMRVMSRFSIVVILFFAAAAAAGFSPLCRRRHLALPLALLVVLATALESRPRQLGFAPSRTMSERPDEAELAKADVLAVIPMGNRWHDAEYMLSLASRDHPLVNGWGGFVPSYQVRIGKAFGNGDVDRGIALLSQIYPSPTIVLDRTWVDTCWGTADTLFRGMLDMGCIAAGGTSRFALLHLPREVPPSTRTTRRVRNDLLHERPRLEATVSSAAAGAVDVYVNAALLGTVRITGGQTPFAVTVPGAFVTDRYANTVELVSRGDVPFTVTRFDLAAIAPPGGAPPERIQLADHDRSCRPELPVTASACQVNFGPTLTLRGYSLTPTSCRGGDTVRISYHWSAEPGYSFKKRFAVFLHARDDDGIRFQSDERLFEGIDPASVEIQPAPKLFTQHAVLRVPRDAPPGRYELYFGIYDPVTGKRRNSASDLPRDAKGIRWQDCLTVRP